jgi:serine/threonine-protein kinase
VLLASNAPRHRRYRVLRTLELASSSEIVLAVSEGPFGFERTVVIKRLLPGYEVDPAMLRSLAHEAMQYAELTHPAIVRMYDFFAVNSRPAMVLEYIDCRSLGRLLDPPREEIPRAAALHVGARVFAALAAAHAAHDPKTGLPSPVVHRHVSPATVLVTYAGDVKLSDFGFARLIGISRDTRTGVTTGSLGYMAPEQVLGHSVTARTDVYCAALLVRELLTGMPVFPAAGLTSGEYMQVMARPHLAPIAEVCPGLPEAVSDALTRALDPLQDTRIITAEELHRTLRGAVDRGLAQRELAAAMARLADR